MRIKYTVPSTSDQGSCTLIGKSNSTETTIENALWDYNSMRAHDGQPPVSCFPRGTKSELLPDYDEE